MLVAIRDYKQSKVGLNYFRFYLCLKLSLYEILYEKNYQLSKKNLWLIYMR